MGGWTGAEWTTWGRRGPGLDPTAGRPPLCVTGQFKSLFEVDSAPPGGGSRGSSFRGEAKELLRPLRDQRVTPGFVDASVELPAGSEGLLVELCDDA